MDMYLNWDIVLNMYINSTSLNHHKRNPFIFPFQRLARDVVAPGPRDRHLLRAASAAAGEGPGLWADGNRRPGKTATWSDKKPLETNGNNYVDESCLVNFIDLFFLIWFFFWRFCLIGSFGILQDSLGVRDSVGWTTQVSVTFCFFRPNLFVGTTRAWCKLPAIPSQKPGREPVHRAWAFLSLVKKEQSAFCEDIFLYYNLSFMDSSEILLHQILGCFSRTVTVHLPFQPQKNTKSQERCPGVVMSVASCCAMTAGGKPGVWMSSMSKTKRTYGTQFFWP